MSRGAPLARCLTRIASALVLAACARGGPSPSAGVAPGPATALPDSAIVPSVPSVPSGSFSRLVAPFPVTDSAGNAWQLPFLGGLDAPRPQLVDIDGDGDADLFLQEYSGRIMFFEHVVEGGRHHFVWRTGRYQDLHVGEWYRFVDLDGDGDMDLLAELPFSYVRYYRNEGTRNRPRFVALPDSVRAVTGQPLFADRQNILQAADIDCNGRVDLLIGRVQGTVTRYELVRFDSTGAPLFAFLTDHFEDIEIVGQAQMGGAGPSLHGANTMALADLDHDGDLDLLWGDFFEPGLLLLENSGTCARPSLRGVPTPFPIGAPLRTSGYNAPAFGDLDGDGAEDLLVGVLGGAFNPLTTSVDNLLALTRTGQSWAVTTRRFLTMIDVGGESQPALVDLDGDGDLDLVVGNRVEPDHIASGALHLFTNVGSATAPSYRAAGILPVQAGFHAAPAFADLDGDGDLDLLLGGFGSAVAYWRNEGTRSAPRYALADSAYVRITRGANTTPALADLDGDGDLDLVVGEASGALNYIRNDGTRTAPRFVPVSDTWLDIDVGRRSAPTFVDLDGDGDLDMVVGSEEGVLHVFRNEGTVQVPRFVAAGILDLDVTPMVTLAFADVNGDGITDLVTGGASGGVRFFAGRAGR